MLTDPPHAIPPAHNSPGSLRSGGVIVLLSGVAGWLIHLTAPPDALDDDQLKPWGYVADIVLHGKWMVQTDYEGAFMSKPPLYQWLCALVAHAVGGVGPFAMYLPTGVAMVATAMLCWWLAGRCFGPRAGLLAGVAFALSTLTNKHMCMARTDALFTFTVALTAAAAWYAWSPADPPAKTGQLWIRWMLFWLAAAAATLTKGPLGLVLGAAGLLAATWERRRLSFPWRCNLAGLALWVLLVGGWFYLAVREGGHGVYDRMIGRELIGHALHHEQTGRGIFSRWYQPPLLFVSRYIPWGIPAVAGLVRTLWQPSPDVATRAAERFVICWFVFGMLIFCAAPHQRADLLLPIVPAAAILAGREVTRWTARLTLTQRRLGVAVLTAVMLLVAAWWQHIGRLSDADVQNTRAVLAVARQLKQLRPGGPLEFLNTTWDAQWAMNVKKPCLSREQAIARLQQGEETNLWARSTPELDNALLSVGARKLISETGEPGVVFCVYSNR